ncbi:hypothetical protein STTU_2464 [Streptomyces sp. Tu6071]|nr:hypothetical protein STTU_2464 [Streptomyces sp. Tu6071]
MLHTGRPRPRQLMREKRHPRRRNHRLGGVHREGAQPRALAAHQEDRFRGLGHRVSFEDAPAFRPEWGYLPLTGEDRRSRRAGHGAGSLPSERGVISTHRSEGDLEEVDDLGVDGPPVGMGRFDEAGVQHGRQAEREPLLVIIHAKMMP